MTEYEIQEIKGRLTDYVQTITTKSKGGLYICPICGSGTGRNHTGALGIYDSGTKWKCQACGRHGDIFDIIGECEHISDRGQQFKRAAEFCGIDITRGDFKTAGSGSSLNGTEKPQEPPQPQPQPQGDFTQLYLKAHKDIDQTDYWRKRGLDRETIDRFYVGYIPDWKHPKAGANTPKSPRLIIPISEYNYTARDTRDVIPEQEQSYKKSKAKCRETVSWTFNADTLTTAAAPIYIVEGEIDAMSIVQAGGEAVGLGSLAYINGFISMVKAKQPTQPLIIALDNEQKPAIEKAAAELETKLHELGIPTYRRNPAGRFKDANEHLQADREGFTRTVKEITEEVAATDQARQQEEQDRKEQEFEAARTEYEKQSAGYNMGAFINGIKDSANTPPIKTGFPILDRILDGGLYEGVHILGAVSSLGKTTFLMQIADQVAQGGTDVLIIALEMSRFQLMAKSISRHTCQIMQAKIALGQADSTIGSRHMKTSRGITDYSRWKNYCKEEKQLISEAMQEYSSYAKHIYIYEGMGDIGIMQVRELVEKHITLTGRKPVVILDYLQILAPYNERYTDKMNTDKAMIELKRITRDFKIPAIAISSFNRDNYKEKVSMAAFKESGAVEYSSDVLIGLQFKGAGEKGFDVDAEKDKDPREVELRILKQREAPTSKTIEYQYYPKFNLFKEIREVVKTKSTKSAARN